MNKYVGYFNFFSEMGSEGPASLFEDINAKYLDGYQVLELSYFFKRGDEILDVIVGEDVFDKLTFDYDLDSGIVFPKEISLEKWQGWISSHRLVSFSINKKLFDDKIILNAKRMEEAVLKQQVLKLLETGDTFLSKDFLQYKNQLLALKILVSKLNDKLKEQDRVEFLSYIFKKQPYYFNSSALEIILRGDGQSVLSWLRDRV